MLSTNTRLKVQFLCDCIGRGAPVELKDMAWLQKLAARNPTVDTWLRQARRKAMQLDQPMNDMDDFCNSLDLGEPDPSDHLVGPQDPVTLAEWFTNKQKWFRGQVD